MQPADVEVFARLRLDSMFLINEALVAGRADDDGSSSAAFHRTTGEERADRK
jgi:hypothetical protein